MTSSPRQLKGNLKMAVAGDPVTDVSDFVSSMVLNTARESITTPGVLSTGQSGTVAGQRNQTLTVTFHSGYAAADMWALMYETITSDDAVADWEATWEDGAVSADNQQFSGTAATGNGAVLLSLDMGAAVGSLRQQTITLPLQGPASVTATPGP
jgi:hypothetical protein